MEHDNRATVKNRDNPCSSARNPQDTVPVGLNGLVSTHSGFEMNPLPGQLIDLTATLIPATGTAPQELAELRRFLAAVIIQQNPGIVLPADPSIDPAIATAILEGAALAAELTAAGIRARFQQNGELSFITDPERPTNVFGPFADSSGTLSRFLIFQTASFRKLQFQFPNGNPSPEVDMLLPLGTAPRAGNLIYDIPAGTVWVFAHFLVPGAAGRVGLRVTGGTLELTLAGREFGPRILIDADTKWTLTVQPEQPVAGDDSSSDASGAVVTLPQTLRVSSQGAPVVTGPIEIAGFGSTLSFDGGAGTPVNFDETINIPFGPASLPWSIAGNRSAAVQLTGECQAASAMWLLAVKNVLDADLGEAANGGWFQAVLTGPASMQLTGMTGGAFRFTNAVLLGSADLILLDGENPQAAGRMEVGLWNPAISRIVFGPGPITRMFFLSERSRGDLVLVQAGGTIQNRWDLPLRASGKPFAFAGPMETFALFARPGALFVSLIADQDPGTAFEGVALENLYAVVHQPSRLILNGAWNEAASVANGTAILWFDVSGAQPALPDPYATNWFLTDQFQIALKAFSTSLTWSDAATPVLASQFLGRVTFPDTGPGLPDEDSTVRELFDSHLGSHHESLSLLDLSGGDHHFGVAIESPPSAEPILNANQWTLQLQSMRLLMQPQVLWEPVHTGAVELTSTTNGARTLAGAASVKLVPVLPGVIAGEWVAAAQQRQACGAMFSLPFGLRAFARLDSQLPANVPFPIDASLHEVDFGPSMTSAQQVRLTAVPSGLDPAPDPSRLMTGSLRQLQNLHVPNDAGLSSVIDAPNDPILDNQFQEFESFLPLHQADLSGYGLSAFSDWQRDVPVGVTQARFDVMNGRTVLEVIQSRTTLVPCGADLVRSVVMERHNSGNVLRFDSGWVPVSDGLFARPAAFKKGVVVAFRKIRRIRILTKPPVTLADSVWREVLYDCDAQLENPLAGGADGLVPLYDQSGYVQESPVGAAAAPNADRLARLFAAVNRPIGGPADCSIRIGGTLDMQLSGIFADDAPNGTPVPDFVVAAYGSPRLPRAGQWSAVSVSNNGEASPVDPRQGIPVIRLNANAYTFRDPSQANATRPATEYGFLMSTATSRLLFPKPSIDPGKPGMLLTAAPSVADPTAMSQSTGVFPRGVYALGCVEPASFSISKDNAWRLVNQKFTLNPPQPDLAKGGEWTIERGFPGKQELQAVIDSSVEASPWNLSTTPNDININIDPFPKLFTITSNYEAVAGDLGKLRQPSLVFGDALNDLKEMVNSLKQFTDLGPGFNIKTDVTAGDGPSPSFVVTLDLDLNIGEGPNARFDIGIGKFYGEFQVHGQLEAALSGTTHGRMLAEFQGDIQQGIIPPLVYAGGFFRFALEIKETGSPTIELGLGMTTSLGGDLIKDLLEVEVTITYGYTLIPLTLQPGVLLRLEARAKLLGGLIGFSFSVQAMARVQRLNDIENVTIRADIRVVATVHIAWLIDEDVDVRTQFEQKIPLRLAALAVGGGGIVAASAII